MKWISEYMQKKYEDKLENYIDEMMRKQNEGACLEQQNLFTKKDYYQILKPVIEVVNTYKDYSIQEMREILYKNSGLEESVRNFIYEKEMVPGMVFSYGTQNYKETVVVGNRQEVSQNAKGKLETALEPMTKDTIFDLASVTKVFTSVSILKLMEMGLIELDDSVAKYAPEFKNLGDVTIFDLLTFRVPLKTNGRVDRATSREEAENILFTIEVDKESTNLRPYTDMGAMVLKYVVENASGMNFYQFIQKEILNKYSMVDTHVVLPQEKLERTVNTNYDCKFYKDGNVGLTTSAKKGIVYDPKAQMMGQSEGNLSGHAGLFSTEQDMTKFAKSLIKGRIIKPATLEMMIKNRTGKKYTTDDNQEKYIQYLGMLCYSKNPILADSELFHAMSGKSFASAGWTGTQLTVDTINELYFFMASNRSHNRMTFIDAVHKDKIEVDEKGKKTIMLPNGEVKIDATRFAWDRDEAIVHPALKLAIQYKMLEDIMQYNKQNESEKAYVRKI